jgi:hypothetical protein
MFLPSMLGISVVLEGIKTKSGTARIESEAK